MHVLTDPQIYVPVSCLENLFLMKGKESQEIPQKLYTRELPATRPDDVQSSSQTQ